MEKDFTEAEFDDFRTQQFEEISENKASLFNYFYENNDIFKCID